MAGPTPWFLQGRARRADGHHSGEEYPLALPRSAQRERHSCGLFQCSQHCSRMFHDDPHWSAWWSCAEQRDLDIEIEYTSRAERSRFTTRKGRAWALLCRTGSRFRGLSKGGLVYLAATDLEAVSAFVSTSLSLPAPPPVPRPAHATPPTRRDDAARARLEEL